ncbi:hypothetical protein I7I50_11448 [Histoplasma capsulatum G186AR]|uniref:Uncharacterized protein n=1 Tax=Ajellomyces capsulatus TaxID=5037 RepID=A0A8H7Z5L8_AJECA|nr:hypothetical protein I7I52_02686 [Histoplasma capsulatum]QSS69970.1 hypothetical protein I7I50_11448 [Histoplasma capsulatum G186AR]
MVFWYDISCWPLSGRNISSSHVPKFPHPSAPGKLIFHQLTQSQSSLFAFMQSRKMAASVLETPLGRIRSDL